MKTTLHTLILPICLLLFLSASARAYYSPEQGRWLSRDPIENGEIPIQRSGATTHFRVGEYKMVANNVANTVDFLGLLQFKTQACQGCNASMFPEWLGYWHEPGETDPECKSRWTTTADLATGFFGQQCGNTKFSSGLCNTDTYIQIKATNTNACCRKWLIACQWEYTGYMEAKRDLAFNVRIFFLGNQIEHFFDYAPKGGDTPPYALGWSKSGFQVGVKYIGRGQTVEVFRVSPYLTLHGRPNLISEEAFVGCTASCWSED